MHVSFVNIVIVISSWVKSLGGIMPPHWILVIEPFDMRGIDFMDHFQILLEIYRS